MAAPSSSFSTPKPLVFPWPFKSIAASPAETGGPQVSAHSKGSPAAPINPILADFLLQAELGKMFREGVDEISFTPQPSDPPQAAQPWAEKEEKLQWQTKMPRQMKHTSTRTSSAEDPEVGNKREKTYSRANGKPQPRDFHLQRFQVRKSASASQG